MKYLKENWKLKNDIEYFSKNKEDVKSYLDSKKYNL